MSVESSRDTSPEQSTPDKAKELQRRLEKGEPVQLYNAIQKLGDDPSFVGRMNLIKRNPSFVEAFNANKPKNMPGLSETKDAYGYKGTQEQNAVYLKTYLEMKASGGESPVAKLEVQAPTPEEDSNAPATSTEDLDDYLAFLPKKEDVNVAPISDVEIRTYHNDPLSDELQTASQEGSSPVEPLIVRDNKPIIDVKSGSLSDVLASESPNERAASLVKALAGESGDLKYLFEAWPMAVSAASTTLQEGLQAQGFNPYDALANTVSAGLESGNVVLRLKDGKTVTTALLPDSAWHPVDFRNAPQTEQERQSALAQLTKPKDIVDSSFFKDDTDDFQFDSDATFTAKVTPPIEENGKKAS